MSKRRRASSVASRGVDEDESDSQQAPEPIKKKKKIDPAEVIQQLFDLIRNFKKEDGSLLCDAFIRAPKRRQEPAYYEVVSNPIDLLKVQQKIKTDEYEDIDDFTSDIELLVNNAKAFYRRNMQEYKDANEIWELLQCTKTRLLEEPKCVEEDAKGKIILKARKSVATTSTSTSTTITAPVIIKKEPEQIDEMKKDEEETSEGSTVAEEELNMCEDLFTVVMTANGDDGHPLHTPFQLLPSKKRYPKYYEVIDHPIDLRMIATKIQQGKYAGLNELEKDFVQMTRNACTFNEPGSMIYKDAKNLRKLVQAKKTEIEQGKYSSPGKASERIRTKRLRSGQTLSAITAAIKSEDEEDDDDGGSIVELEDTDNPCWQLFDAVKSYTNAQGDILSEPFHKLPSKRYYPDYYKEIRNAISLAQISKKLKKGDYGTVSEVAGDLNIMFENAKKYNRADSKLYKDAVKLQKIMQKRVQELLEFDHQYSASEDDSADEPSVVKKPPKPILPGTPAPTAGPSRLLTKGKYLDNIPLKRRLYSLCKCVMTYVCEDGRQPMLMFMEKPSKKLYPDYYEVITKPIDMLTIEANIKSEKYTNQEEILADFKLMFANCRKYNEEGSMIFKDALTLERILMEKVKELGPLPPPDAPLINKPIDKKQLKSTPITPKPKRTFTVNTTPKVLDAVTVQKLRTLYVTLRDYRDPKGRQLSQIFLKLPSKVEYPDYYEVIKKPINLEVISQKLKANAYEGLEDLCSDFILMFDNACKYNEPDSQIYKDALTLQRVAIQTKLQLRQDEHSVPDVPAAVQELLTSLFISVYNHQDEEGRCFSDSMQELPEHDEVEGKKVRALSLDLIKRRLDGGQYKRLDTFQDDVFSCLQRARTLSRSDSQVFEDSVELQSYFIRQRDELCRNGDLLHSPALNYTLMDLSNIVDEERQNKQAQEEKMDGDAQDVKLFLKDEPGSGSLVGQADNALSYNQQVYRIGDFVYAEGKERGMEPIILNIQRLWTNQEGGQMLYGNQYYRPNETYHVTTRKFLQKEVFKTEQNVAIPLNQVLGRCCVLSVKDYFRSKPEGVDEKDVYVCESRYSARARAFKKIKNWPPSLMTGYKLIPRDEILEPKRVMSVFRQRVEKHKEEIAELEEQEKLVEKEKPNISINPPVENEEGFIYYEQLNTPAGVIKTGDCVYMKSEGKPLIAQADTIWINKDGEGYFRGPWMVMPTETPHSPSRLFYKQEVLLSSLEDTHPTNNIVSKCVVLEHGEYISCRPTEYLESDVYVCESVYDEVKRTVRELPREGLKKYTHSAQVTQDEIYFFRRLINPPKVTPSALVMVPAHPGTFAPVGPYAPPPGTFTATTTFTPAGTYTQASNYTPTVVESHPPPQVATPTPSYNPVQQYENSVDSDVLMEDSMDGPPPSVASDTPHTVVSTPLGVKKMKGTGKKLVTGYILYSGDVRKAITVSNPDCNFGEVSRIVGNEWRKLPASEKAAWEERAARINEENKLDLDQTWSPGSAGGPPTETVFECCWDTCDWQFEDSADAVEHAVAEGSGHVFQWFQMPSASEADYQCQWRGCTRTRKTIPPFPNVQRLARHVKEVHLLKSTGKVILSESRSKHYVPSRKAAMAKAVAASQMAAAVTGLTNQARSTPSPLSQNGAGSANGRPVEPLFITVPPRPQRLLHSEAYIKYIEGLTLNNTNISNWDKQLRATQATIETTVDQSKLPSNWLNNSAINNHGNIVNALWTLRDFMFRDALGISKHL